MSIHVCTQLYTHVYTTVYTYNRENEILPLWETKRPKTRKQNRLGKHKSDKGKAPYRSYRSELNAIARRASHEAYG